jgi:hypothetical protein
MTKEKKKARHRARSASSSSSDSELPESDSDRLVLQTMMRNLIVLIYMLLAVTLRQVQKPRSVERRKRAAIAVARNLGLTKKARKKR